jgi:hypothetical protein
VLLITAFADVVVADLVCIDCLSLTALSVFIDALLILISSVDYFDDGFCSIFFG